MMGLNILSKVKKKTSKHTNKNENKNISKTNENLKKHCFLNNNNLIFIYANKHTSKPRRIHARTRFSMFLSHVIFVWISSFL